MAVVTTGVPNSTTTGGSLIPWSVIHCLAEAGHDVHAVLIEGVHTSPGRLSRNAQLDGLRRMGVKVSTLDTQPLAVQRDRRPFLSKLGHALLPTIEDFYPTVALSEPLEATLRESPPEAIFVYQFEALAPVSRMSRIAPVVAAVGDPSHLPDYYRWKSDPFRPDFAYARTSLDLGIRMLRLPHVMSVMMNSCSASGSFAAHEAEWYRKVGVSACQYFRIPVVDEAGPAWAQKRRELHPGQKFKILLIGHLKGVATLSGLDLFARDVLPALEKELGAERFEVHIVGGYAPPSSLLKLLQRPSVVMRGQVEPATEEFLSSDVLVVPTPIKLGTRVRIITGFAAGCCVVAHEANALGIPEVVHRENALLASDGRTMAECILAVFGDAKLKEALGARARKTYEENFAIPVAGGRLADELRRVSRQ